MTERGSDAHHLGGLARELQAETTSAGTFHRVVKAALEVVPVSSSASVSTADRRAPLRTEAASDALAARGDELQVELGQGPCIDAAWEQEVVVADDLTTDRRWPQWSPRVVDELGARSMLCLRLYTAQTSLGALNLYATQPGAFSPDHVDLARAFVAHCAVAIAQTREIEHLNHALDSRTAIANAVGMVMHEHRLDATAAFELLVRHSSHQNRKLADIAAEMLQAHTREVTAAQPLGMTSTARPRPPRADAPA